MCRTIAYILVLAFVITVHAQDKQRINPPPARRSSPIEPERPDVAAAEIHLARSFSEKLWGFRDLRTRAISTAKLARLLWKQDPIYARALFDKALGLTIPANDSDDVKLRSSLNRNVISIIASCDREWARQLIDATTKTSTGHDRRTRSLINNSTALSLLSSDLTVATEFAQRGIEDDLQPRFVLDFLLKLRKTDEQHANRLFVLALAQFELQPIPDVSGLHFLGIYLFTAPGLPANSEMFHMTVVDNLLVPNITADRPGIPPGLSRAYLSTAANVLWKALPDTNQKQHSYVLGYLLLPKARRLAPDLASRIETAMSAISTQLNPNLTQESAYKYIRALPSTPEESFAKAEAKPDQYSRDIAYFDIAASAWLRSDFKTARTANSRISDLNASQSLGVLIDFAEAGAQLKDGTHAIDATLKTAYKLPAGVERAVLLLAIAEAATKAGQTALAEETLDSTIKASATLDDVRRPFLILIASSHLMALKSSAGESFLANAVKDFNRFTNEQYSSLAWEREVEVGPLKLKFPLNVIGVDFSFEPAIRRGLSADHIATALRVDELRNEDLKARGFLEVASAHLLRAEKIQKAPSKAPK